MIGRPPGSGLGSGLWSPALAQPDSLEAANTVVRLSLSYLSGRDIHRDPLELSGT